METLADRLHALADADGDLARSPEQLGAEVAVESEPHAGIVHGARHVVLIDPLLVALPLPRAFVLAAGGAGLVDLVLPADAPALAHDLLTQGAGLAPGDATRVVDLTVDALEHHLGVRPDPHAGLTESGHALAQLDLAVADAVDDGRRGIASATELVLAAHPEITGAEDLARRLGRLGLTETAALVAATAG